MNSKKKKYAYSKIKIINFVVVLFCCGRDCLLTETWTHLFLFRWLGYVLSSYQ